MEYFLKSLLYPIYKDLSMTMTRIKEEFIHTAQQYDLIYSYSRFLYTILPNAPHSCSGDLSTPMESHATDGLIRSMSHTYPHPNPPKCSVYGNPHGGLNTSYGYPNPPQYSSHSTSKLGTSTTYLDPHAYTHVHGIACNVIFYGGVVMKTYYPFLIPPPGTSVPPYLVAQNLIGHHTPPPQGKVYTQHISPNPLNQNKKKNKRKCKKNNQNQGN